MKVLRPIGHDDRLSVVDHLDELRSRLFICAAAVFVIFCICFWQNGHLITILNRSLPSASFAENHASVLAQKRQAANLHRDLLDAQQAAQRLASSLRSDRHAPGGAAAASSLASALGAASRSQPKNNATKDEPFTFGVGESFTTTLLVVGYFTLIFALPIILYELYAFVIPALTPGERKVAVPSMIAAPILFAIGAVFTYFEVLPPAVHFLQGYNSSHFQIIVQAKTYYKFEMFMMLGIGLAFQVPLLLLALQKAGLVTSKTLTLNWRYAVVIIAVIAAALPGVDPVTMFFETLPLVVLYLASIVTLTIVDRRKAKRALRGPDPIDYGEGS